ncbi:uncharacterized protein LOC120347002 [Styela clava]
MKMQELEKEVLALKRQQHPPRDAKERESDPQKKIGDGKKIVLKVKDTNLENYLREQLEKLMTKQRDLEKEDARITKELREYERQKYEQDGNFRRNAIYYTVICIAVLVAVHDVMEISLQAASKAADDLKQKLEYCQERGFPRTCENARKSGDVSGRLATIFIPDIGMTNVTCNFDIDDSSTALN